MSNRPKKGERDKEHACSTCGDVAYPDDKDNPVVWGPDPYASEILLDDTCMWLCESCIGLSNEEI